MRPLIIGQEEKDKLKILKEYAEAHPMTMDDLLDILSGAPPVGLRPEYQCSIPFGYKVVFTIEPNSEGNLIRHLSVSVDTPGKYPHPIACQTIMDELGFVNKTSSGRCRIYEEKDIAINIAELI